MKKVYIGSDHAGYAMKEKIKTALEGQYEFSDLGTHAETSVDYPIYAETVARKTVNHPDSLGVVICGSGIGVSMVANKVDGARAALCYSKNVAALARQHNNANILATAGREATLDDPVEIVKTFLETEFSGDERHARRVQQMMDVEKHH
jgi:RpiB/LacA/LacB family sugar-phosphate isomerase